jgi:ferredoxin-thioredoxin reductase catalytic subunit
MDHGWMYTKHSLVAFVQGLELFINVVSGYMEHNVEALGFLNCPCRDYKNLKQWDSMELIRGHLL